MSKALVVAALASILALAGPGPSHRGECFACVPAPCTSSDQCGHGCVCAGRVIGRCVESPG